MRLHVLITGRVQGVGFRYHTCQQARKHGLSGWVRNLSDGRVEAEFQGADADLEAMVMWCERGPAMARVTSVDVEPRDDVPAELEFRLRSG